MFGALDDPPRAPKTGVDIITCISNLRRERHLHVTDEPEILTRVDNGVGLMTLNRPKAINSLNQSMVDTMTAVLGEWARDDTIRALLG